MFLRILAGLGLLSISMIGAFAADLPIPMKALPLAAPIYTWTGCYVGGDIGGVAGRMDPSASVTATVPINSPFADQVLFGQSSPLDPSAFTAGAVGGCNYQTNSNFVVGLEADFGYMGLNKSTPFASAIFAPELTTLNSISTTWLSTVRGRVGYAAPGDWLVFATGGLAMTDATFNEHYTDAFPVPGGLFLLEAENASTRKVMTGWTVGGGLEKALGPWSIKFEYLYADFGRISTSGPVLFLGQTPEGITLNATAHLTAQILRAGFTYKFWN